jgi:hypothetical protein
LILLSEQLARSQQIHLYLLVEVGGGLGQQEETDQQVFEMLMPPVLVEQEGVLRLVRLVHPRLFLRLVVVAAEAQIQHPSLMVETDNGC